MPTGIHNLPITLRDLYHVAGLPQPRPGAGQKVSTPSSQPLDAPKRTPPASRAAGGVPAIPRCTKRKALPCLLHPTQIEPTSVLVGPANRSVVRLQRLPLALVGAHTPNLSTRIGSLRPFLGNAHDPS
jgi:hypothetical protein